jgi:hypothetical protein
MRNVCGETNPKEDELRFEDWGFAMGRLSGSFFLLNRCTALM